jgi:hypothetical protein
MVLKDQYAVLGRMLTQMAGDASAVPEDVLLPVIPHPA